MRKLFMMMGSALGLALCLNWSASLASSKIQEEDNAMDITSPKQKLLKESNIFEESKKIEEEKTGEELRKEQAGKAAYRRFINSSGLNKSNKGSRTKHNAY